MTMTTITQYLKADHHRCDTRLAAAETCVAAQRWSMALAAFLEFDTHMRRHLDLEESILFPAFEQMPGTPTGPTTMMRLEHQQIRDIAASMKDALTACDADGFSAEADVLHIMMGQHNMKEESVLYPMADRFLADRVGDIVATMQRAPDQADRS